MADNEGADWYDDYSYIRKQLDNIDPYDFEQFVGDFWREYFGFDEIEVTSKQNDGGIDVKATRKGDLYEETHHIQAKTCDVGPPTARECAGVLAMHDVDLVVVVTTGGLTNSVDKSDHPSSLKFIELDDLAQAVAEANLEELPDYEWLEPEEEKEEVSEIECALCNEFFAHINAQHLDAEHNMEFDEYGPKVAKMSDLNPDKSLFTDNTLHNPHKYEEEEGEEKRELDIRVK